MEIASGEGTHSVAEGIRWPILAEESVGCCVVSSYDYVATAQVGDFCLRGVDIRLAAHELFLDVDWVAEVVDRVTRDF